MKWVDFAVDLEIGREMLSLASKTKYTLKQRQYKLFGVVYHNGREATKGHYVADVYHTGRWFFTNLHRLRMVNGAVTFGICTSRTNFLQDFLIFQTMNFRRTKNTLKSETHFFMGTYPYSTLSTVLKHS